MLLLTATLAVAGNASADHGYHECTEEDPCDNSWNPGCDGSVDVDCGYDGHYNCYYGFNEDGENSKFCKHESKNCLVNVLDWCHLQGETPISNSMALRFAQTA